MKKTFILLLLLLVIISGCSTQYGQGVVDNSKNKEESTSSTVPIKMNVYKIGDVIDVGGKEVLITGIDGSKISIKYNGLETYIDGTKNPIRINDYELIATQINVDYAYGSTISIGVHKIELQPDEYLFWYKESKNILGKKITLANVFKDEFNTVMVDVSTNMNSDTLRIQTGKAKTFENVEITNVRSVPRATSSEKYAIIKVKNIS